MQHPTQSIPGAVCTPLGMRTWPCSSGQQGHGEPALEPTSGHAEPGTLRVYASLYKRVEEKDN